MIRDLVFVPLLMVLTMSGWTGCSIDAEGNRVIGGPGFGNASIYNKDSVVNGIKDRGDAISKYLSGKELTPIEGVWVSDNNQYEVAIVRNRTEMYKEYDYLGILTSARNTNQPRGQIKMLLKETSSPQAYSGTFLNWEQDNEFGTLFLLSSPNLIEFSAPVGPYESSVKSMMVRNFPKESRSSSTIETEHSSGSGFFVTQDLVATNYHVVRKAKNISVAIGGVEVEGELLLKDSQNDLALIRVNSKNLPNAIVALKGVNCLTVGDSNMARSGDAVFTLGFPLSGLLAATPSVSQGIISNSAGMDNDPRMFQVSAPIQPGNSGSPLLDANGDLIGIITSTLSTKAMIKATGAMPQNVNFAIKSSYLKSILSMVPASDCANSIPTKQNLTAREVQDNYANSIAAIKVSK